MTLEEELGRAESVIRTCCGPLHFTRSLDTAGKNIETNGSFGLVDTGLRKLLVTCCHVWEGFQQMRQKTPGLRMGVSLDSDCPVALDFDPISIDQRLDLATFDLTPLLWACEGRAFFRTDRNPPPDVQQGEVLLLVGYPGRFRSATKTELEFGRVLYALRVADVSGPFFIADMSKAQERFEKRPRRSKNPHGGISGAPCFVVREGLMRLAGFVTESGDRIMRFTHARCLASDGNFHEL